MKKILSVMLAIMMLFGAISVTASAASVIPDQMWGTQTDSETVISKNTHVILSFNFNGGKSYYPLYAYDATKPGFVSAESVSGTYIMLPGSVTAPLIEGSVVELPLVVAPEGYLCKGWYCNVTKKVEPMGEPFTIPDGTAGQIIYFTADCSTPAEKEADTMATVLDILMKVFGTIIGILFLDGSSSAGVELMNKLLGGLLG